MKDLSDFIHLFKNENQRRRESRGGKTNLSLLKGLDGEHKSFKPKTPKSKSKHFLT